MVAADIAIDPTPLLIDNDDQKEHQERQQQQQQRCDDGDHDDDAKKKKRGHRVLYCCDTRRAVLLFTIIQFVTNIMGLISITILESVPFSIEMCILYSASMVFYLLVLYGTIYYRWCAVLLSLLWEIIAISLMIIATAMFDWNWENDERPDDTEKVAIIVIIAGILAWRSLVIYSLGMFVREVKSRVMSVETHDREKYSCCCNA